MSWDEYYDDDEGGHFAEMDFEAEMCDEYDGECENCELRMTCASSTYLKEKTLEGMRKKRLKDQKGMYLITCNKGGKTLYLQDQRISNKGFWTQFKSNAKVFILKETAEKVVSTLHYNDPKVVKG